jgi:hypothetical protein
MSVAGPLRYALAGSAASDAGAPSEATLEVRRSALLSEMRSALEDTRARRATIAAALENVRIQLLRIGAGIGTADDMSAEVAAVRTLSSSRLSLEQ